RRRWLDRGAFLDFVSATNLIPGPNSTELALHLGYLRGGWRGLLTAGTCFILPAAIIASVLAALYQRFGTLPDAVALLDGVRPVVVAVVAHALWRLGRTAVKDPAGAVLGTVSLAALVLGAHELVVLAATAVAMVIWRRGSSVPPRLHAAALAPLGLPSRIDDAAIVAAAGLATGAISTVPISLMTLFLTFAKIGAVLFGSGYVLFAFLRADFVERLGWLTEVQLLDVVAIGQVIPGPLFTTATFIGYLLAGPAGALIGTVGIFLPAFVFVALSGPIVPRLRQSAVAGAALDGLNVASLALMVAVTGHMAKGAWLDPVGLLLGLAAFVLLWRYRIGIGWLVFGGATAGLLRAWLQV
ncbi:MAG: chromate efflux transporter, partial [Gemmatimonadales bacterium]